MTGQNPASSGEVAEKAVEALNARAHWIHVVPYDGAWTFKHEHGEPEGAFRTQKQVIEAARNMPGARRLGAGHPRPQRTHPRRGRHPLKAEAADTMPDGLSALGTVY